MSSSGDNTTFARTIKLLVANLDKTKERIQDRFMQVDERIDELESLISSVQQNLRSRDDGSTKDLMTKVEILSNKVDELETKLKDIQSQPLPTTARATSVPVFTPTSVTKNSSTPPLPGSPPVAKPPASSSSGRPPTVGSAPTPTMTGSAPAPASSAAPVPATSTSSSIPSKLGGPPLPGSTPIPTSSTPSPKPSSPPPSAGVSVKPATKISIKDNKSEKDQLLEALKQLEGI